ncbi:MAG: hypothetical protein AB1505_12330 [Candidatus Latescibacterota bacterium]
MQAGVALGLGVALLSAGMAWLALQWALRRAGARFVPVFLGGLVVRVLLVGTAALVVLRYTAVHRAAFAASLVGGYLVGLVAEVVHAQVRLRDSLPRGLSGAGSGGQVAEAGAEADP